MTKRPRPKPSEPIRADVTVATALVALRLALGLPPSDVVPGELAATRSHPLPRVVPSVDLGAWIAWALAGLPLFAREPIPTMKETLAAARRVLLAVVMERTGGNLTHAARLLGASRRALRDHLRQAGLYRHEAWTSEDGSAG